MRSGFSSPTSLKIDFKFKTFTYSKSYKAKRWNFLRNSYNFGDNHSFYKLTGGHFWLTLLVKSLSCGWDVPDTVCRDIWRKFLAWLSGISELRTQEPSGSTLGRLGQSFFFDSKEIVPMVVEWGCRSITPALYHPEIPSTQWESYRNFLCAFIDPFSIPQRIYIWSKCSNTWFLQWLNNCGSQWVWQTGWICRSSKTPKVGTRKPEKCGNAPAIPTHAPHCPRQALPRLSLLCFRVTRSQTWPWSS